MKKAILLAAALLAAPPAAAQTAAPPEVQAGAQKMLNDLKTETPDLPTRLAVARDYIRYIGVSHEIARAVEATTRAAQAAHAPDKERAALDAAMKQRGDNLAISVGALSALHPGSAESDFVINLRDLYKQDQGYYDELNRVVPHFSSGGQPSPDDMALFQRDTGLVLQIDGALLNLSQLVLLSLTDTRSVAASGGKRLYLTRVQRDDLVARLDAAFGPGPITEIA